MSGHAENIHEIPGSVIMAAMFTPVIAGILGLGLISILFHS